jgi:hypothetical protein
VIVASIVDVAVADCVSVRDKVKDWVLVSWTVEIIVVGTVND